MHDIEAFLATRPANRKSRLTALRQFFAWARTRKLVLADPTRGLTAREPRGFRGPTARAGSAAAAVPPLDHRPGLPTRTSA